MGNDEPTDDMKPNEASSVPQIGDSSEAAAVYGSVVWAAALAHHLPTTARIAHRPSFNFETAVVSAGPSFVLVEISSPVAGDLARLVGFLSRLQAAASTSSRDRALVAVAGPLATRYDFMWREAGTDFVLGGVGDLAAVSGILRRHLKRRQSQQSNWKTEFIGQLPWPHLRAPLELERTGRHDGNG